MIFTLKTEFMENYQIMQYMWFSALALKKLLSHKRIFVMSLVIVLKIALSNILFV